MVIVVMGVSGAGKTSAGRAAAALCGATFIDADDLHPASNRAKMARGEALTEDDRAPWLEAVRARIDRAEQSGERAIVACSALRRAHRDRLRAARHKPRFAYLEISRTEARRRLEARADHFMPTSLLDDQFETLEPPGPKEGDVARLDASASSAELAPRIVGLFGL